MQQGVSCCGFRSSGVGTLLQVMEDVLWSEPILEPSQSWSCPRNKPNLPRCAALTIQHSVSPREVLKSLSLAVHTGSATSTLLVVDSLLY
jgi:hypothetical protein